MASLVINVSVTEGKKEKKLTSFMIGDSVVKSDLAGLNKETRQARIKEMAKRFLTTEQQLLQYSCKILSEEKTEEEKAKEEELKLEAEKAAAAPVAQKLPCTHGTAPGAMCPVCFKEEDNLPAQPV